LERVPTPEANDRFDDGLLEALAVVQGQPALGGREPPGERPEEQRRQRGQ
jgi:hypothetical protein